MSGKVRSVSTLEVLELKLAELDPESVYWPSNAVIEQLNSIYPVSRETICRFSIYNALLNKWQAKTNLVAPGTLTDYWNRHVADSLQLLSFMMANGNDLPRNWIDLGSGGGFPGLILAIVLADQSDADKPFSIVLVESIQKKCAFLRRVVAECQINRIESIAHVQCARIESVAEQFVHADILTARALAPLEKLLEFTGEYLGECPGEGQSRRKKAFFHKGRDYQREIEESRGKWDFDLLVHASRIDRKSVVLEISNVSRLA